MFRHLHGHVFKGQFWVPFRGYPIAVVPPILPLIALYNHYIYSFYNPYIGGKWWYIYLGYSPKATQLFPLIYSFKTLA